MTKTNAHALLTVGLRVISAYYLVFTLTGVVAGFFITSREFADQQKVVWAMQLVSCVLFAGVWLFADKLAGIGVAPPTAPAFQRDIEPRMWLRIGVVLIGIWSAADALGSLVHLAAYKWLLGNADVAIELRKLDPQSFANVISSSAQLVIGLWLTLGARGFVDLVERARFAGPAVPRTDDKPAGP